MFTRTWSLLESLEALFFYLFLYMLFLAFFFYIIVLEPEINLNPLVLFWGDLICFDFFLKIFGFCCLIHNSNCSMILGIKDGVESRAGCGSFLRPPCPKYPRNLGRWFAVVLAIFTIDLPFDLWKMWLDLIWVRFIIHYYRFLVLICLLWVG